MKLATAFFVALCGLGLGLEHQGFKIQNVNASINSALILVQCSKDLLDSAGLDEVKITYDEGQFIKVSKSYQIPGEVKVKVISADSSGSTQCQLEVPVWGLVPLKLYHMCLELVPASEAVLGPFCVNVKTPPDLDQSKRVALNLDGVALIVMISMVLMLALMVCVFYDKVLTKAITGCRDRGRGRLAQILAKREDQGPIKEVVVTEDVKAKPPGPGEPQPQDDDAEIREALEKRPHLMDQMKAGKRRKDMPMSPPRPKRPAGGLARTTSFHSRIYNDNPGFEVKE